MKSLPRRPGSPAAFLWMRVGIAQFAAALFALAGAFLLDASPAKAANARPITLAVAAGIRPSVKEMDLGSASAFGGRLGLGVTDRFTVLLDAQTSSPERMFSGRAAHVSAVRALAQARILTGEIRPYLTLGGGALIFNYGDAYDAVGGIVTVGGGLDWRVAPRTLLFAEATGDFFGTVNSVRLFNGEEIRTSPGDTQAATALFAGIAVEF